MLSMLSKPLLFLLGSFVINDLISALVVRVRKILAVFLGITFKYDLMCLFGIFILFEYSFPIVEKYLPNSFVIHLLSNTSILSTCMWSIIVVLSLVLPIHEFITCHNFRTSFLYSIHLFLKNLFY